MKDEKGDGSGRSSTGTCVAAAPKSVQSSPEATGKRMQELNELRNYLDETGWEDDEQVLRFYRLRAELYVE